MKQGDKVYVNWPTGRGGPYEYSMEHDQWTAKVVVNGDFINVSKKLCEPAEPEIEDDRLYYYEKNSDCALHGKYISHERIIKPVHRRWDELRHHEQGTFVSALNIYSNDDDTEADSVFRLAYKLITGEEHP